MADLLPVLKSQIPEYPNSIAIEVYTARIVVDLAFFLEYDTLQRYQRLLRRIWSFEKR